MTEKKKASVEFVLSSPKHSSNNTEENEKDEEKEEAKKKNILYIHSIYYVLSLANYFLLEIWWFFLRPFHSIVCLSICCRHRRCRCCCRATFVCISSDFWFRWAWARHCQIYAWIVYEIFATQIICPFVRQTKACHIFGWILERGKNANARTKHEHSLNCVLFILIFVSKIIVGMFRVLLRLW